MKKFVPLFAPLLCLSLVLVPVAVVLAASGDDCFVEQFTWDPELPASQAHFADTYSGGTQNAGMYSIKEYKSGGQQWYSSWETETTVDCNAVVRMFTEGEVLVETDDHFDFENDIDVKITWSHKPPGGYYSVIGTSTFNGFDTDVTWPKAVAAHTTDYCSSPSVTLTQEGDHYINAEIYLRFGAGSWGSAEDTKSLKVTVNQNSCGC